MMAALDDAREMMPELPLDTTLVLETPEHIGFRYQLAGAGRRSAAYLVDLVVRGLILFVVTIVAALSSATWVKGLGGLEIGVMLVLFFALEWGYFVVFEVLFNGSSPGKRAFRLRVIHQDGRALSFSESLLRNLLRAADLLPFLYAVGLSVMLFDRHFRRLGDLVAGTVVVFEPRTTLRSEKVPSMRDDVAGLPARPRLSADERAALALFHRRLPYLSRARAAELADIVAPVFRQRFGVEDADSTRLLEALYQRIAAT